MSPVTPLLLIGESHYLPADSKQHLTAEAWYSGNASTLNGTEQGWINTSDIVRPKTFTGRTFSIFRNAFREINDNGPRYPNFTDVADYVVFYNYFQRPARYRASLDVKSQDTFIA